MVGLSRSAKQLWSASLCPEGQRPGRSTQRLLDETPGRGHRPDHRLRYRHEPDHRRCAAIVFAASFYRAVGFGRTVQEAFDLAKVALLLEGIPEDKTPAMSVRAGVNAATMVLVSPRAPSDEGVLPPQESSGASPAKSFRSMDRSTFVKTLGALSPSTLDLFVASVENAASHVSRHGTVAEHAAELVRWAESSTGPGLATLQEAFESFR